MPLSRLVPVLNDTYWLSRVIHQLLHVSFCEYSISLLNLPMIPLSLILSGRQRSRNFRFLVLNLAAWYLQALSQFSGLHFYYKKIVGTIVQSSLLSFIHKFPHYPRTLFRCGLQLVDTYQL